MSEVVRRANIFGARQFQRIVEELLELWKISGLTGLSGEGAQAQDKLMKVPARLERMADYVDAKATPRAFRFAFAYDREIVI
jgi:acyl-[acyl-carrier-protein] desaturase